MNEKRCWWSAPTWRWSIRSWRSRFEQSLPGNRRQVRGQAKLDLDTGAALSSGDLTFAPAQFGDAQSRLVVQAGQLDRVVGRPLSGPAFRDPLLVGLELEPVDQPELEPGTEAVTVAVRPDAAVSGALRPND